MYSRLSINKFEEFCEKHLLCCNNEVIAGQLRYKDYVEKNYYPLLELQEIMRRNTVSNIHIKVLDSLMEVEFCDEQGRVKKQSIYFVDGTVEYCEEGVIDFSGIDKAVICKAEKLGLNYWDHI